MTPDQPPVNVTVNQAEPSVTITLREVYDEVRRTSTIVAEHLGPMSKDVHDLEKAVEQLKGDQGQYVTKATARWLVGALISLVGVAMVGLGLILNR